MISTIQVVTQIIKHFQVLLHIGSVVDKRQLSIITEEQKLADFIEFGAWHAMWIHPDLNRFGGYDNIKLGLVT